MLNLHNINAGYGKLGVLWDISLNVSEGEFVALVGPNGAGKTTILRTIVGLTDMTHGEIRFMGERIDGKPVQTIVKSGISFVTDDGCLFPGMTVYENIIMGAYIINDKSKTRMLLNKVWELFPQLVERKRQQVGTLSGGERKMVAIARGLMSDPKLMLVDEPSLGLAPKVVMSVLKTLKELTRLEVTVLLVEQNANITLKMADRGYVIEQGHIVFEGLSKDLRNNDKIKEFYLG